MRRTTRTLAFASVLCAGAGTAAACGGLEADAPPIAGVDASASAPAGDADVPIVPRHDAGSDARPTCGRGAGDVRPGNLDGAFGNGGFTTFEAQTGGACVATDSKGRIYVAATKVLRFSADGQPDPTYAPVATLAKSPACAVDAADRFLVVTSASACEASTCWALRRFDDDGKPDTSFGTSGEVVGTFGGILPDMVVRALASGEILVAATSFHEQLDEVINSPAIARLSASGAIVGQIFGPSRRALRDIDVDPAGGFVLALAATSPVCAQCNDGNGPFLSAYDGNLSARSDFAPAYPDEQLRHVRRRADGKLIVVNDDARSFRRLLPSGAADPTFAGDGGVGAIGFGFYQTPTLTTLMLALEDDSWILVGNSSGSGRGGGTLVHFREDGALDTTFGDPSTSTYPGPGGALVELGSDGDGGAFHTDFRAAALDARGVVVVAALSAPTATGGFGFTQSWAVARVCR